MHLVTRHSCVQRSQTNNARLETDGCSINDHYPVPEIIFRTRAIITHCVVATPCRGRTAKGAIPSFSETGPRRETNPASVVSNLVPVPVPECKGWWVPVPTAQVRKPTRRLYTSSGQSNDFMYVNKLQRTLCCNLPHHFPLPLHPSLLEERENAMASSGRVPVSRVHAPTSRSSITMSMLLKVPTPFQKSDSAERATLDSCPEGVKVHTDKGTAVLPQSNLIRLLISIPSPSSILFTTFESLPSDCFHSHGTALHFSHALLGSLC